MKELWLSTKKPFLRVFLIVLVAYVAMSSFSYYQIQKRAESLTALEEKIKQGEVEYSVKQQYKNDIVTYQRSQNLLQSFWLKYLFDFPDFEGNLSN